MTTPGSDNGSETRIVLDFRDRPAPAAHERVDLPPPAQQPVGSPSSTNRERVESPPPPTSARVDLPAPRRVTAVTRAVAVARQPSVPGMPVSLTPPARAARASAAGAKAHRSTNDAPYLLRAAALLIDVTIISSLAALLGTALFAALLPLANSGPTGGFIVLILLVTFLPFLLATVVVTLAYTLPLLGREGERNGQTLGKQLLGLRLVRLDEAPVTVRTAVLREVVWKQLVLGFGGAVLFFLPTLLTYLWPLWDEQGQTLHDKGAGTRVVRSRP